jgi:hypothetical protein
MYVQAHRKYIRLQPNSIMSNQRISAHCFCITGENARSSETADTHKKWAFLCTAILSYLLQKTNLPNASSLRNNSHRKGLLHFSRTNQHCQYPGNPHSLLVSLNPHLILQNVSSQLHHLQPSPASSAFTLSLRSSPVSS